MTNEPVTIVVLVVDDEPLIRLYAADILADAGYEVIEAADAREALAALDAHPEITVLFTDINMPGPYDGLELARKVHAVRPDVQLIITSGKERPSLTEIPREGAFVPKPYRPAMITGLIEAAHRT